MNPRALLAFLAGAVGCAATSEPFSRRMLESIKLRQQGVISSGASSSTLESAILAQAIEASIAQCPDPEYQDSDKQYLAAVLTEASKPFTNATWAATRPLDRFSLATGIERASAAGVSVSTAATAAYNAINASLALQTRNPDGGLWYYIYPEWSYLDGMVSLLPFMASAPQPNITDMHLQIDLLQTHCKRADDSLLVHGYDWSRTAVWANNVTGGSPFVWGRSLGWYLAGMVQTYERLGCVDKSYLPLCGKMRHTTVQILKSLVELADGETGAWWQLTTFPGRAGNYLESSSTALFIFSILKAVRINLIPGPPETLRNTALKAYDYTIHNFVTDVGSGNGTIGYDSTVSVCSLNSTATYEYYTTQPIVPDSLLGESAFILASLEVERL